MIEVDLTCSKYQDYTKLLSILHSCNNYEQRRLVDSMILRFLEKYEDRVLAGSLRNLLNNPPQDYLSSTSKPHVHKTKISYAFVARNPELPMGTFTTTLPNGDMVSNYRTIGE